MKNDEMMKKMENGGKVIRIYNIWDDALG